MLLGSKLSWNNKHLKLFIFWTLSWLYLECAMFDEVNVRFPDVRMMVDSIQKWMSKKVFVLLKKSSTFTFHHHHGWVWDPPISVSWWTPPRNAETVTSFSRVFILQYFAIISYQTRLIRGGEGEKNNTDVHSQALRYWGLYTFIISKTIFSINQKIHRFSPLSLCPIFNNIRERPVTATISLGKVPKKI